MMSVRIIGAGVSCALLATGIVFAQSNGSDLLSQGQWATMLVQRLGLAGALKANSTAEESAALLGARGASVSRESAEAVPVLNDGALRTWRYDVNVPRTASWLVTVMNTAPAFVSVDRAPSTLLRTAGADGGSDGGVFPLVQGPHAVSITAKTTGAPGIVLTAGCHPVLPAGGWQTSAKLTYGNLARTLVHALGQNGRLPAAEGLAAVAVSSPRISLDAPSEGAYTVLVAGKALERVRYRIDGCDETTVTSSPTTDGWREGATVLLTAGTHTLSFHGMDARLRDGKARLVRRVGADAEYLAVLQSLGVKLEGKTASLAPGSVRTGLARRAEGDATGGLAALAGRNVTREEAERILNTPSIQKALSKGVGFPKPPKVKPTPSPEDDDDGGTLVEPVTNTLQQAQDADPL